MLVDQEGLHGVSLELLPDGFDAAVGRRRKEELPDGRIVELGQLVLYRLDLLQRAVGPEELERARGPDPLEAVRVEVGSEQYAEIDELLPCDLQALAASPSSLIVSGSTSMKMFLLGRRLLPDIVTFLTSRGAPKSSESWSWDATASTVPSAAITEAWASPSEGASIQGIPIASSSCFESATMSFLSDVDVSAYFLALAMSPTATAST